MQATLVLMTYLLAGTIDGGNAVSTAQIPMQDMASCIEAAKTFPDTRKALWGEKYANSPVTFYEAICIQGTR
jgi:hypothetical protein